MQIRKRYEQLIKEMETQELILLKYDSDRKITNKSLHCYFLAIALIAEIDSKYAEAHNPYQNIEIQCQDLNAWDKATKRTLTILSLLNVAKRLPIIVKNDIPELIVFFKRVSDKSKKYSESCRRILTDHKFAPNEQLTPKLEKDILKLAEFEIELSEEEAKEQKLDCDTLRDNVSHNVKLYQRHQKRLDKLAFLKGKKIYPHFKLECYHSRLFTIPEVDEKDQEQSPSLSLI